MGAVSSTAPGLAPESISLAMLEAHDPKGGRGPAHGRRWRCPLPECHNSRDRDLSVDEASGAWNCHNCKARGKLLEHRATTPAQRTAYRSQARSRALASVFSLAPAPAPSGSLDPAWRGELARLQDLEGTPGAKYLQGRGIPPELAQACGVRFSPSWTPRREDTAAYRAGGAVVFPLCDRSGAQVAANGRYLSPNATPKTRTGGDASSGTFEATAARLCPTAARWRALEAPAVILCEGPMDALSLALCGYPALAAGGCNLAAWVPAACAFKRVLIASDADERGDEAASTWSHAVRPFAAQVERLRPQGGKDWNEVLQVLGADALADQIALQVLLP